MSLLLLFTTLVACYPPRSKDVRVNLNSRPGTALITYEKMTNNKIEKKPQNANYYQIGFVMQIFIWLWVNVADSWNTIGCVRTLYVVFTFYHINLYRYVLNNLHGCMYISTYDHTTLLYYNCRHCKASKAHHITSKNLKNLLKLIIHSQMFK